MKTMKTNKLKVFFRRVSTASQDLAMQEAADLTFRNKYLPNEIQIINEHAVSANKLGIEQRPQIQKLINMIKADSIDTIFVFDRSRLFRDFYEGSYFVSLCKKHNVKILFTSAGSGGYQQATDSTLIEGVLNIVGDEEGKNIARRTEEARRLYPPRKFGFIKEVETKRYLQDPTRKGALQEYFSTLLQVTTESEVEETINKYKKMLGTTFDRLLKISQDPFYAGYDLKPRELKLTHVDPYLTLEQHQKLKAKKVLLEYLKKKLNDHNIYNPFCGICNKQMTFKQNVIESTSGYSCSRKHPRVFITTKNLTSITNSALEKAINHLEVDILLKDSRDFFRKTKQYIEKELEVIKKEKMRVSEAYILNSDALALRKWKEHPQYKTLSKLEIEQEKFQYQIEIKQRLLVENEQFVKLLKDYLNKCRLTNLSFLQSMLLQDIYIYPTEVELVINKFDYLQNLNTEFQFKGEELL